MASPFEPDHWERVAAELRALRDAQQEAWGTLDNATLGRYLADEVSGEERRQIEQALDNLPELRKVTDLVRDVLIEFEPVSVPAPAVLPFSPQPTPQQPARRKFWGRAFQQRAVLAAAACLLLALGLSLHGLHSTAPESAAPVPPGRAAALPRHLALKTNTSQIRPLQFSRLRTASVRAPDGAQLEQQVAGLEKQGKLEEALVEAERLLAVAEKSPRDDVPQYAAVLNRVGQLYQQQGQLAKAEPVFRQAYGICQARLGADHPETVLSVNNLANSYQLALNYTPADNPHVPPAIAALSSSDKTTPSSKDVALLRKAEERARLEAPVVTSRVMRQSAREVKEVVVPVLTRALRQAGTPRERLAYIQALGRLGPAARDAVPALAQTLEKAVEPAERLAVIQVLGLMGPSADNALPLLAEALKSPAPMVRRSAAAALLQCGPQGLTVLNDLVARGDPEQKAEAKRALFESLTYESCCSGLKDTCYLFSPRTMNETQLALTTLARNRGVAIYAETTASRDDKVASAREKQARDLLLTSEGIYFLICKEPPHVELQVSEKLRQLGFTVQHQKELRDLIEKHLKNRDYDTALREGVRYLDQFAQARKK